jgi:hypothetical protein
MDGSNKFGVGLNNSSLARTQKKESYQRRMPNSFFSSPPHNNAAQFHEDATKQSGASFGNRWRFALKKPAFFYDVFEWMYKHRGIDN